MPDPFPADEQRPLYEIKANLFKALAHPARIRVLEILSTSDRPTSVSEILAEAGLEPTVLSQHLAVLKRHHVVRGHRVGNAVIYELAHPKIAELLVIARRFSPIPLAHNVITRGLLDALPPLGDPDDRPAAVSGPAVARGLRRASPLVAPRRPGRHHGGGRRTAAGAGVRDQLRRRSGCRA